MTFTAMNHKGENHQAGKLSNMAPMGSEISIDGEVFEVADRCGIDGTVDIFIENDSDHCQCDTLDYKKVYIKTNKKKGGQN